MNPLTISASLLLSLFLLLLHLPFPTTATTTTDIFTRERCYCANREHYGFTHSYTLESTRLGLNLSMPDLCQHSRIYKYYILDFIDVQRCTANFGKVCRKFDEHGQLIDEAKVKADEKAAKEKANAEAKEAKAHRKGKGKGKGAPNPGEEKAESVPVPAPVPAPTTHEFCFDMRRFWRNYVSLDGRKKKKLYSHSHDMLIDRYDMQSMGQTLREYCQAACEETFPDWKDMTHTCDIGPAPDFCEVDWFELRGVL
ncbi:hypothetical protein MMC24_001054 [Lignoscripta atroalba]|nr:hypothetical protein [Lignoscripta atroalba]